MEGEEKEENEEEEEECQLPAAKRGKFSSPSLDDVSKEVTEAGQPGQCVGKLSPNDLEKVLTELYDVRAEWENIGLALELSPGTLDSLKAPFKQPKDCLRDAVKEWLNTCPDPSWKGLTQALRHCMVGKETLARHLEQKYCGIEVLTTEPIAPEIALSPMDCFVESLKAEYERVSASADNKLYPTPTSVYTNLAVVKKKKVNRSEADKFTRATLRGGLDEIMKRKKPISLKNVFKPKRGQRGVKYVLVEGAPGVGKSTFALELCRRWDSIKLMKRFVAVVLLRLREKRVQEAKSVTDLFYHDSPDIQKAVTKQLSANSGENVLLILDGFDELPVHLRRCIFLAQIIRGQNLQKATILVTSRPSARADLLSLHPQPDKHIEVLGFTSELVDQYAESVFNADTKLLAEFCTYTNTNPAIKSMMYIPLNSAIVVEIYQEYRTEGRPIPQTMTQLYTELTLIRLKSYLREQRNWSLDHLPVSLEDLSRKTGDELLCLKQHHQAVDCLPVKQAELLKCVNELLGLAKLAFDARRSNKVIFETLPADCTTLGLMNASQELYLGRRGAVSYNFFHFTHQEFLAAFHISQLPVSEQRDIFLQCLNDEAKPPEMSVVWKFVAGLTGFEDIGWDEYLPWLGKDVRSTLAIEESVDKEADEREEEEGQNEERKTEDGKLHNLTPFLAQCLYEAQAKVNCGEMLRTSRISFDGRSSCLALDCFVVGYCVSESMCAWSIDLADNGLGPEMIEMLLCGLRSGGEILRASVRELDIGGNPIGVEGVAYLKELPHKILKELLSLTINSCKLDSKALDLLSSTIIPNMNSLKELDIHRNPVGKGEIVTLFRALSEVNQLHNLITCSIEIGHKDTVALSSLIRPSVGSLRELVIGDEDMLAKDVEMVLGTVFSPSSLEHLDLFSVDLTETSIASLLKHNNNLIKLTLGCCILGHEMMPSIAKTLCNHTTLRMFTLEYEENVPTDDDIKALSEVIGINQSLEELVIRSVVYDTDTTIGREAVGTLVSAMKSNQKLRRLVIQCPKYCSVREWKGLDSRVTLC